MSALTFDTHKHIKQLQSKGISEEQAEAIVDVVQQSRAENNDNLVSKPDLHQYKSDMKVDFQSLENKMQAFENRIQKEIAPLRTQMAVMMWTQGLIVLTVVVPAIKQIFGL